MPPPVKRAIVGYHRDEENDWVAELDCHHNQHVRNRPPFTNRPWVETREGRDARLGSMLDCVLCDELALPENLVPYKRTPTFTETTVPAALLAQHATKRGVWGQIAVEAGELEYAVEGPVRKVVTIAAGERANIAPEMPHAVRPLGRVSFFVEFFRPERS